MNLPSHPTNVSKPFCGKVCLVTGASRGIGKAIVLQVALDGGAHVAVNFHSNEEAANAVVAEIVEKGGSAVALQADVGQVAEVRRLYAETLKAFGVDHVDFVVNNAAILERFDSELSVDEAAFDRMMSTNVKGCYFSCQEAANCIQTGGRIINIGSAITHRSSARSGLGVYAITKAAVAETTRFFAAELAPKKVSVITVSPGITVTDMASTDANVVTPDNLKTIPAGRFGQPEDVSEVVYSLLGKAGQFVVGACVPVNGGFVMTL